MKLPRLYALRSQCHKFLSGARAEDTSPRKILSELAAMPEAAGDPDIYGDGDLIASVEGEVARLLGKPAAVFMVSGTMAQQIALRIWSERKGTKNVAFHPKCHLETHEDKAYQNLHGLHALLIGLPERLITLDDLKAIREPVAALLLELPQRDIGSQLPTWPDLVDQAAWTRQKGIALHMDGARLWESKPFYEREYSQIAGLFDSVYVSVYKGLGGIAGSFLAGEVDFIQEARLWQHRHGGVLIHQYPMLLSALKGLREEVASMEAYHLKALEIAEALGGVAGIRVLPNPPQTNMLHIYLEGEKDKLEDAAEEVMKESGVFLFGGVYPTSLPGWQMFELSARKPSFEVTKQEITDLFTRLMQKAK